MVAWPTRRSSSPSGRSCADSTLPARRVWSAVLDVLPNEQLDGPRPAVLYALGLAPRTAAGRIYPFSTYVGWLREAGYEEIVRYDLSAAPPVSLITARRA